jgi:phenylacetate-coenzyme A ligase PaaK-like adenylate-forming protein
LDTFKSFISKLYTVNDQSFTDIALALFRHQVANNAVYKEFVGNLGTDVSAVNKLEQIPFLPISLFKDFEIKTGNWENEVTFTSSGTTTSVQSRHAIPDLTFYQTHAQKCFEYFFGNITDYHFLALLPSYLERQGSSLIAMVDYFIKTSGSRLSGFYLNDQGRLMRDLDQASRDQRKTILWGVTFALLEMAGGHETDLGDTIVIETGGMKGKGNEITRAKLHEILSEAFKVPAIYSEYGMTELLSQAYTKGDQLFFCPPWMKVVGRELTDPLQKGLLNVSAGINVIDLANWHSIAFVETEDLGIIRENGAFEVLGRIDNSDIRGCNLLLD